MATKAGLQAQYKYDTENTRQVMLKLNKKSDADILKKLDDMENRQGYIKDLVRKDIRGNGDVLTTDAIRYLILPVVKKYGLKSVGLFGSYARGEASVESDIDLVIEGGNYKGLFGYMELLENLENRLKKKVDLVTREAIREPQRGSDRHFAANVLKDEVKLYAE